MDRLTGAFTAEHLDHVVAEGFDVAQGPGVGDDTMSTMIVDIDDFELYDGAAGRPTGEQVLERVAWRIMASARATDVIFRQGESRFCVLLPTATERDAEALADRIRSNVDTMPPLATCGVAVTIGVSTGSVADLAETVQRAERARASCDAPTELPSPSPEVRAELEEIFSSASGPGANRDPVPISMLPPASTPFAPPTV